MDAEDAAAPAGAAAGAGSRLGIAGIPPPYRRYAATGGRGGADLVVVGREGGAVKAEFPPPIEDSAFTRRT